MRKGTLHKKGFTIIELLVVIVMIGLLTAAAAASYSSAQRRSRDSARKSQVNTIATAVETYYAQHRSFPGKAMVYVNAGTAPPTPPAQAANCEAWNAFRDSTGNNYDGYVYMYDPHKATSDTPCSDSSRTGSTNYDPTLYTPGSAWIPGLGDYLSPFPSEKNYLAWDGSTTGHPYDYLCNQLNTTPCSTTTSQSRTLIYRPLLGGYLVYARLENTSDQDAATATTLADGIGVAHVPEQLQAGLSTTGLAVYAVRK